MNKRMSGPFRIEPATIDDAPTIAAIYGHHVEHGVATFEVVAPPGDEMRRRMGRVLDAGWPWLVARDENGAIIGFAYITPFRERAGFRYTCENSVYIRHDRRGEGIGRALLALLIVAADRAGFRQMIAVIGGAEAASARLHAACGFVEAGRLGATGRKHGRWLDTLFMQRALGPGEGADPPAEPE